MKISEVAERSGLSIDTLRFYEKIGLIAPPARDAAGRRVYDAEVLGWIAFLGQLNATGMKQADRIRYAQLRVQGPETCAARRQMLEERRAAVALKITELQDTLALLDRKVAHYRDLEKGHANV
ncbi:MerR family transcriptional regulator [Thalassococcus sp. S3]|uniref:MerR family transcriptional regulator n=1 Tax=Thalassococcus sp. S3 TaxID=2017482 RepID=UPI0010247036|nr:MerR family transcriptional regulator [Thalassococcus sp. S3]QBF31301.1 MerR family transcriptional regulator [Thalassococcus sp. S3]